MAYSDFTLESAVQRFSLSMSDHIGLHESLAPVEISPRLAETLNDQVPLATAIHTEKARSELIVVPILMEARKRSGRRIGFFSGVAFDVDLERGLNGVCDFLLSRSPVQHILGPPVFALVEAKNDSIKGGLGQCIAEMVAAQIYNERQPPESSIERSPVIHGAVTTGSLWRFLRLEGSRVQIDRIEYNLDEVGKIVAILIDCLIKPDASLSNLRGDA